MNKNINHSKDREKDSEKRFNNLSRALPALVIGFFILVMAIYFYAHHGQLGDQAIFGAFGDFIGGLFNPFLTFLTVMLLIYSIRFQIDELKINRNEIKRATDIHKENIDQSLNNTLLKYAIESIEGIQKKLQDFLTKEVVIEYNPQSSPQKKVARFMDLSTRGQWNSSGQLERRDYFKKFQNAHWRRIILKEDQTILTVYDGRRFLISSLFSLTREFVEIYSLVISNKVPTFIFLDSFNHKSGILIRIVEAINRADFLDGYNPKDLENMKSGIKQINLNIEKVEQLLRELPQARLTKYKPPYIEPFGEYD